MGGKEQSSPIYISRIIPGGVADRYVCFRFTLHGSFAVSTVSICLYTAISIKVVPEQSEKVEYVREKLAGS